MLSSRSSPAEEGSTSRFEVRQKDNSKEQAESVSTQKALTMGVMSQAAVTMA